MKEKIEGFLKKKSKDVKQLGEHYPEKKSLILDWQEIERFDRDLAEEIIKNPDDIIEIFEAVLKDKPIVTVIEEPEFHVRFTNLPKEKGYYVMVRELTTDFIGRMLSVDGVVNKIGDVLPKVQVGTFICVKCGERNHEPQPDRLLREPLKCSNCERRDFRFDADNSTYIDIQRLEIQESLEMLKGGEQARRIEIWTEDDLTDNVTAGNTVLVTGILRLRPPQKKGSVYSKYIEANFIESIETEFEDIQITDEEKDEIIELSKDSKVFEKIVGSIAPSIYGYNEVKEAIALQLFGGRPGKVLPDGTKVRPDIHLLLVGDPGVAKSRILLYVDQIAPKSIYVTGKGTTGAGLTATAEKDEFAEGSWVLRAGALVLAGGGIVAIDEFDKMEPGDRSAMHEAMEQQTISVAKAGIVTKFKANTSVLAASNPKYSRFDTYKPIAEQFDIPPTLISRFDLIFPIRDILDSETDRKIADQMLKMHQTAKEMEDIKPPIETDIFRKYIAYARLNVHPVLSDDSAEKIKEYYVSIRARSHGGTAAATPRQLEALVRLAEASAKLRLDNTVTIDDVDHAISLTEFVLREIAYDEASGTFDIDRVVTDHPKSTRDRIRSVDKIIRELIVSSDDGLAQRGDILGRAIDANIERFEVEKIIDELKKKGDIYEPKHGRYKLTEDI